MMPPHKFIHKIGKYEVFLRRPGFESFQNSFGKVASFIVRDDEGNTSLFAFAYSGLDAFKDPNITDDNLLDKAVKKIEAELANRNIIPGSEYTYIYINNDFEEDNEAKWWIRTSPSPSPEN